MQEIPLTLTLASSTLDALERLKKNRESVGTADVVVVPCEDNDDDDDDDADVCLSASR
jgi:hypothetical protein